MGSPILKSLALASALVVLVLPSASLAGGALANGSAAEAKKRAASASGLIRVGATFAYAPPMRGSASSGRVGGGTRGTGDGSAVTLEVLVPDHAGLTVSAQPTLYWFVSERIESNAELTIVDDTSVDPPARAQADAAHRARHPRPVAEGARRQAGDGRPLPVVRCRRSGPQPALL